LDQDQRDSGPPPTGEKDDWNELVASASKHAKERADAIATPDQPPTPPRTRGILFALLTVVFLAVVGWNIYFFTIAGDPQPSFEAVSLRASLFLAQQAVEEAWEETGSFPASLVEVGADEEGLSYVPAGSGYTITAVGLYHEVGFRRGDDLAPLEAAFQALLSGEVRR